MNKAILLRTCAALAVPFAAVAALPIAAAAQQITTEINGTVASEAGQPVGNASVTITDTRTGASQEFTTGADGRFSAQNLTTGGPYTVTATAQGFQGQTVEQVVTTLQGATQLSFTLSPVTAQVEETTITVTGARARVTQLATGPGQSFGTEVLENAPTFNRDVRDIIRLDPRVSLTRDDGSDQDRVSCLGGNDRGNAFTVDGVAQSDVYGLNETGFSARNSTPLPFDAVRETQVQFAPFDVEYGQFTGCAINVVTKSGSNRIRATAFYERTSDEWTGDSIDGDEIFLGNSKDERYGITLGGPIIRDRLFLFGAYERQKGAESQDDGPRGGGFANELAGVSEENFNDFREIVRDVYGIETGDLARSLPFDSKRFFLRSDLQITDAHRLEVTYQHIDEFRTNPDDLFVSQTPTIVGENTFFRSGSKSNFYSGRLFSRWTDRISSEVRWSRSKIRDRQDPVGGGEAQDGAIPRIIVGVSELDDGGVLRTGTLVAGPGFNRAANDLRSTIDQGKAALKVDLGAHKLKLGVEYNKADVFNLFVANATGTLVFRNLTDLAAGLLSPGTGNNSTSTLPSNVIGGVTEGAFINRTPSGDITDAAADFSRTIYSLYAQDDWAIADNVDLVLGLRTDFYDGDNPRFNPVFFDRYGVTNTTGFGQIDPVIMPRAAVTFDLGEGSFYRRAKFRAGLGLFTGGDPLVWFGNVFQNNGQAFAEATTQGNCLPPSPGQIDVTPGGTFDPTVLNCLNNAASTIAATAQGRTQTIDPDIKMMTVLRGNLGLEGTISFGSGFFSGWRANVDYIWSRYRNPFTIVDLSQAINPALGLNGFTRDGRPIYRAIDLTRAGCTGELVEIGSPPQFENLNAACFGGSRQQEYAITNSRAYTSQIASFLLSKNWDRGILTSGGGVYFNLGYAWSNAKDRRNLFNSTANSNFQNTAAFDRQDPSVSTGFYNTKHNFTLSTNFTEQFFKDLDTKFGFTFTARSGRPYSLTFSGGAGVFNTSTGGSANDNALLYIPTGADDSNIVFSNVAARDAYLEFIEKDKCARKAKRGRTIERNTCQNDAYYDLDLRFSQQLPAPGRLFGQRDSLEVYAMVDNFLNLLDDKWNVFRRRQSGGLQDVITLTGVDAQGRYLVSTFNPDIDEDNTLRTSSSLWRLKVGVSYRF